MIRIKRAYEEAEESDGRRVLVDRLWPRGVSKEELKLDAWHKDIAPSPELRKWFGHDPTRWEEFQKRYRAELQTHSEELRELKHGANHLTLIYAAKDPLHNNAVVLKQILEEIQ